MTTTAAAAADLDPLQPAQEAVLVPDVPSTAHEDAKEESDAGEVTSQKSDEKKEDKHEEKTESNHQETQDGVSNASASGSQDQEPIPHQESSSKHGESRGDVDGGKNDDEVWLSGIGDNTSTVEGFEAEGQEADETEESPKACWDVF